MKTADQYAREAWCKLSLGNIATPALDYKETGAIARPANFDEVVRELAPYFQEAIEATIEECIDVYPSAADTLRLLADRVK